MKSNRGPHNPHKTNVYKTYKENILFRNGDRNLLTPALFIGIAFLVGDCWKGKPPVDLPVGIGTDTGASCVASHSGL